MRLLFQLTPPERPLGFDYPYYLCAAVHKWLGLDNPWHDRLSLYSFGWLAGGQLTRDGLIFPDGAEWFVSSYDSDFLANLLTGAYDDREVCFGMRVKSIKVAQTPRFHPERHTFRVSGPVLLKKFLPDNRFQFLTFQDGTEADEALTQSIRHKLDFAGLDHLAPLVKAHFHTRQHFAKTKMVRIKNIDNKASQCPIVIEGNPEILRFVWLSGVGNSTGVGFGGLMQNLFITYFNHANINALFF